MRVLALEGLADTKQDPDIHQFLKKVLPKRNVCIFNQALMELGALVCRNKEPLCLLCPVKTHCKAYAKGVQEIIPETKKKILKDLHVAIAVIERNGKFFIQKRPPKGLLADLWEFPGGKLEADEVAKDALVREVREELGQEVQSAKHLMNVQHFYTQYRVHLSVWSCILAQYPLEDATHKWVSRRNLTKYPMPSGSAKIVDKILKM